MNAKDLFFLLSKGSCAASSGAAPGALRPENVTLEQLLSEFRRRRRQNWRWWWTSTAALGMVTVADVVAEVVGDVAELGRRVEEVRALPGGRFELPGTTQLDDLEERLDVTFDLDEDEEGEVTTIAGYLMAKLGRVPRRGTPQARHVAHLGGEVDGPRVVRVMVEPGTGPKPPPLPRTEPPRGGYADAEGVKLLHRREQQRRGVQVRRAPPLLIDVC